MSRLVVGTRGSELARAQTALVAKALRAAHPNFELAVEIIRTSGDERKGEAAPGEQGWKGLFTAEIERALRDGEIDAAVHSAKDLPSEMAESLEICAALPRGPVEDVLLTKTGGDLVALKQGATVATGSVRRQHQLRYLRPDLKAVNLRGNVPTRLRKLSANDWDAAILARAGLERLGYDCGKGVLEFEGRSLGVSILPVKEWLPAGGQGIVAMQTRVEDGKTQRWLAPINHAETLSCLEAEREFLRLLGGDCGTPVGVLATLEGGVMTMRGQIFEEKGGPPRSGMLRGAEPLELAERLLELIHG